MRLAPFSVERFGTLVLSRGFWCVNSVHVAHLDAEKARRSFTRHPLSHSVTGSSNRLTLVCGVLYCQHLPRDEKLTDAGTPLLNIFKELVKARRRLKSHSARLGSCSHKSPVHIRGIMWNLVLAGRSPTWWLEAISLHRQKPPCLFQSCLEHRHKSQYEHSSTI